MWMSVVQSRHAAVNSLSAQTHPAATIVDVNHITSATELTASVRLPSPSSVSWNYSKQYCLVIWT